MMDKTSMINLAARVAHEVNRVYCESIGDHSQPKWDDAPDWQRDSARNGARLIYDIPGTSPEMSHVSWLEEKKRTGWKYGPVKDTEKKEHPCFVPYKELPADQQIKDALFGASVRAVFQGVL